MQLFLKKSFDLGLISFLILFGTFAHGADILIPTNQILNLAKGKYYLIGLGVNNYKDEFWPTLKWPASDATRVTDRWGTSSISRVEKKLLINEFATLDNVIQTLNEVAENAKENDTVVLYISGHGTLLQNASGELERIVVLHDSDQSRLLTTGLLHSQLNTWMQRLRAKKKMMVFATCHSGEGKSRLPNKVKELLESKKGSLPPLSEMSEGALVLAAAAKGESARENDELKGDIYTHYLLEALTVYDRNRDGMVSALEAHDYARDRTWAFTKGKQRPTANIIHIGDADIPLYGKKITSGLPILEAYDERMSGFYLQVDGATKGRLPFAFPLKSKGSIVSLYTPGGVRPLSRYKVNVETGKSISLGEVMNSRPISVGVYIRNQNWSDNSWEDLTGSPRTTVTEFNLGYHWNQFGIGFTMNLPLEKSNAIRAPIESTVELTSHLLTMDYSYKIQSFTFIGRAVFGREQLDIQLNDKSTRETLTFTDDSYSKGISLFAGYKVAADFSMLFEVGMRNANWEYNTIGDLSGNRRWLSLGFDYRFGRTARTMW